MSTEKTESLSKEFQRAAELINQLNLVQTLDDIPCEHVPRTTHQHSERSVRITLRKDMVRNAHIGVDGDYQPLMYSGGSPLLIDEPCIILRQNPHTTDGE